jgi:hypothetical protein
MEWRRGPGRGGALLPVCTPWSQNHATHPHAHVVHWEENFAAFAGDFPVAERPHECSRGFQPTETDTQTSSIKFHRRTVGFTRNIFPAGKPDGQHHRATGGDRQLHGQSLQHDPVVVRPGVSGGQIGGYISLCAIREDEGRTHKIALNRYEGLRDEVGAPLEAINAVRHPLPT